MTKSAPRRHLRSDSTLEWLPAILAGLFLVAMIVQMGDVINVVYRDSDAASAPVLARLIAEAPAHRQVFLGNYPWYESLWFLQLTDGLPHQRLVWQGGPVLLYLVTVTLVAGSAWLALGRRAGLLATAVLVCLSTPARLVFFAPNFHAPTAGHAALLGAALVVLARRAPLWHRWHLALIALVLGVITALGTASDALILAVAIGPVATAAVLLWFKDPVQRNVALCVMGACAIAVVLGGHLEQHMLEKNIAAQQFPLTFLAGADILERFEGLAQAFAALVGGDIFGREIDAASLLRLGALTLATAALVLVAVELHKRLRAPAALSRSALSPAAAGAFAHVAFWGLSAAGTIAAYVLTTAPTDAGAARYLGTLWLALGALLGLLAMGTRVKRTAVGLGAALFAVMATVTLFNEVGDERPGLITTTEINQLAAYAKRTNVQHGLAGYWDANNVTWATRLELRLLAVHECGQRFRFCPYPVHRVTTSYEPVRGERSMLVVDPRQPMVTGPDALHGTPRDSVRIGELTVYVYGYDIRSRITAP